MKDAPMPDRALLKAQMDSDIVTQTLDKLNTSPRGKSKKGSFSATQDAMSQTYDLSKSVLSAALDAKGVAVALKG